MNFSSVLGQGIPASHQPVNTKRRKATRQAAKDLLLELQSRPLGNEVCLRCGQRVQYIDTTFWLYGDEGTFHIRVPECHCAEKRENT